MTDRLNEVSSIVRVTYFQANPVHTCDNCSQGIKHVFSVLFRDGLRQEYGSECINKVLATAPSLKTLFAKNSKLLQKRMRQLAALSAAEEQMPRGSEYYGSGLYFIADDKGEDICFDGHYLFHPVYDVEKNSSGHRYVITESEHDTWVAKQRKDIEQGKAWLQKDIERLELFLAKVLRARK